MISDVVLGLPSPPLAPYVARYIGYWFEGFPPGLHRGLPSRHLTFIVSLGKPVQMVLDGEPGSQPVRMTSFVGGLQTWPAQIHHDGTERGIAVEMKPLGASVVLGVPAGELAGRVVDLDDLLAGRSRELMDRLLEAADWPERFAALDDVLTRGLCERYAPDSMVAHAWDRLVRAAGTLPVDTLADEVGWSRRHLTERIRREVGLPPRQLNRVLRFERSRGLLHRPGARTLTEVAFTAGYFDHAHMVHEWRRLAGCTPSEWLREELPSVQDDLVAGT